MMLFRWTALSPTWAVPQPLQSLLAVVALLGVVRGKWQHRLLLQPALGGGGGVL
jgi:hypothetical protein